MNGGDAAENDFGRTINGDDRENEEIEEEDEEQEKDYDQFNNLNSQDEDEEEEAELRPKLAEGFYEIEAVRRKRVRKGQVQYLIKWRGWPETANTWEPYENLVSCFDVIEAFEEGLRSGKHRSRKRKRRSSGLVPQAKKKTQGTPGASTSSAPAAGKVKFDEGSFVIPFVGDLIHENGSRSGMGDIGNDDAIEQGNGNGNENGNGSVAIPPQVEEGRDQYEMDVNLGEYTGTPFTSRGSNRLAIDILGSETLEAVCFENGHEKVVGQELVQANGRLRNRRKPASVKRFIQKQTSDVIHENGGRSGMGDIGNDDAIEQGNGNGSIAISPQVENGRDQYGMDVNLGGYTGTPFASGGSNRLAIDILGSETSEAICFENRHEKVDGEGLVQANVRLRNRRKPASVKRFIQKQTSDVIHENGGRSGMGDIGNDDAMEQGNGNGSIAIPPQVEEGRDQYEMNVNLGGCTGTSFASGGSNRLAIDILESETSEAICFENGHEKVDGEGLVQANGRLRNRRKPASVKRFNQEQCPCVTNYAAQDLTTKNTRASGIAGQNWDKNSGHGSKSDNITNTFPITEIIKPISFSSSGFVPDIVLTFMAKRSDGKEVMVDNKYLKANYPLLLINYYEQHLNYNATAGPDRSGRGCMAG